MENLLSREIPEVLEHPVFYFVDGTVVEVNRIHSECPNPTSRTFWNGKANVFFYCCLTLPCGQIVFNFSEKLVKEDRSTGKNPHWENEKVGARKTSCTKVFELLRQKSMGRITRKRLEETKHILMVFQNLMDGLCE